MDPLSIARLLVPAVPTIATDAFWHSIGQSPTSTKWDLKTAVIISAVRNLMFPSTPSPVSRTQARSLIDPGVKGKTWVATAKFPAPTSTGDRLAETVCDAVDSMAAGPVTYTRPKAVEFEVEWTGYRSNVGHDEPPPPISEEEKYQKLMADPSRTGETTILYLHGGAYYLCDPSSHRSITSRLAKQTSGRACSIRYRLAPQAAFPSQLIDAFMAYLTLLYPPPGSFHEAIPASKIVVSGDSAGGNLAMALLQLILHLRRSSTHEISFHGTKVAVPLPAGLAINSGWFDISRSMPSLETNAQFDYLPAPSDKIASRWPHDDLWPTDPPRGDMFCDLTLLDHPLASVVGAESWTGSPPLWICNGQEMLSDEIQVVARRAVEQDVVVQYEQYEAMPHVFNQMLRGLQATEISLRRWGDFCRRCVEEPAGVKTSGTHFAAKTNVETVVDVATVTDITVEDARRLMGECKERRFKGYEGAGKAMPDPAL